MDSWVKLFNEHLKPNHEKHGIPIEAAWVNLDRTEFIWVKVSTAWIKLQLKRLNTIHRQKDSRSETNRLSTSPKLK